MFDSRRVGGDPQLHYTVHLPALARSVQVPTSSGWQPGALTFWWSWTCLFLYSQPRKICRLNDASVYMDVRFLPDFFGCPTKTYQHQHCQRCRSPFPLVTLHFFKDQLSSMSRQLTATDLSQFYTAMQYHAPTGDQPCSIPILVDDPHKWCNIITKKSWSIPHWIPQILRHWLYQKEILMDVSTGRTPFQMMVESAFQDDVPGFYPQKYSILK